MRGETLKQHPEVGAVLGLLAGSLDEDTMRGLQPPPPGEARERGRRGPGRPPRPRPGRKRTRERRSRSSAASRLLRRLSWRSGGISCAATLEHLGLSAAALLLGALVSIPLGLWLERHRRWAEAVIRVLGLFQTVPSLALLAFMIPLLGVGALPAIVALWIYSLFPIVRNTYTGVRDADPKAVEAATALGMTPGQILREVRLPLAAPVVMAGLRTAAVITVGTATLAAFIGAGGLGEPIVTGLQLADSAMILSGAIPGRGAAWTRCWWTRALGRRGGAGKS